MELHFGCLQRKHGKVSSGTGKTANLSKLLLQTEVVGAWLRNHCTRDADRNRGHLGAGSTQKQEVPGLGREGLFPW